MMSGTKTAIGSARSVKLGLASSPEASSAWFKTVVDPAHAREYGCRGIPDENREPTLVLQFRDTTSVSAADFKAADAYNISTGAKAKLANVREVYIIACPWSVVNNLVLAARGTSSDGSTEVIAFITPPTVDRPWASTTFEQARPISTSVTVDWIGTELYRGGYFEAGYLPTQKSGSGVGVDVTKLSNYVTYTNTAEAGVYAVGQINQYDQYRWWRNAKNNTSPTGLFIGSSWFGLGLQATPTDLDADPYSSGWRAPVVRYMPISEEHWVLRITAAQAVEVMAAPEAGGTDGADYDPGTVQGYIAFCDQYDLIFPAEYNDAGALMALIGKVLPRAWNAMKYIFGSVPGFKAGAALVKNWLQGGNNMAYAVDKVMQLEPRFAADVVRDASGLQIPKRGRRRTRQARIKGYKLKTVQ